MKVEEFSTMPFAEIRDAALVRTTLICESLTIPVFGELPPPDFTWVILGAIDTEKEQVEVMECMADDAVAYDYRESGIEDALIQRSDSVIYEYQEGWINAVVNWIDSCRADGRLGPQ